MFKRILVPVDGSATSNRGLDQAIRLARGARATVCLLHVVDELIFVQHPDAMSLVIERLLPSLRENGRRILARAEAAANRKGVKTRKVLVENIVHGVADVIVRQAAKLRADLIVMGTHGRRGLNRVVMGSDAEGVVRTALVPVLLVRGSARGKK